jgi:hypothetical protein
LASLESSVFRFEIWNQIWNWVSNWISEPNSRSGIDVRIFFKYCFCGKNGLELGVNQQLTTGFRLGYSEPGNIARFHYWVLECSQKYEGILNFFTFISCL